MLSASLRLVLALGTAQTLAWGSTYYLPAILAVPMAADLGVTTGFVYGAFSAGLVLAALLGPAAGRRIDLFGGRGMLSLSSLIFAAGLALLGASAGPGTLVAAWLVIGVGMSMGLYEAAFATLTRLQGRDARGAITGITLLAGFASTICWPLSALLDAEFGWRATCFFWAAMHLVIGLPLNRFLVPAHTTPDPAPPTPSPQTVDQPADQSTDQSAAPPAPTGQRLRLTMVLLATIFAVSWMTASAMAAHLPRLLIEAGATPTAAIAAAALVGPAQVIGRMLEFGIFRHYHPLLSARMAAVAHPLGAAALLVFGAPAAAVFAGLHGIGTGILTIAQGTLPLALFGPAGYGRQLGVLMIPARFAQATAPFAFALLLERFGVQSILLTVSLSLLGLACLLTLATRPEAKGAHL